MKTIRANCFETNSSSTHSITIESKSKALKHDDNLLVIDGVLRPDNLASSTAYREINDGDGHILYATTEDQKAALLICHILSLRNYGDENETLLNLAAKHLVKICGYKSVKIEEVRYRTFYNHDDGGSTYLDDIKSADDLEQAVIDHIMNVVINDDAIVTDSSIPT